MDFQVAASQGAGALDPLDPLDPLDILGPLGPLGPLEPLGPLGPLGPMVLLAQFVWEIQKQTWNVKH